MCGNINVAAQKGFGTRRILGSGERRKAPLKDDVAQWGQVGLRVGFGVFLAPPPPPQAKVLVAGGVDELCP